MLLGGARVCVLLALALCFGWSCLAAVPTMLGDWQIDTDDNDTDSIFGTFSDDFVWATATSSYQVEGAWNVSYKAPSIWDTNSHECASVDCDTGDVACDSYHLWRDDIELLKQLGVNSYRLSISWPRLFYKSTPGPVDYNGYMYYSNLFDELIANNITPIVTLFHWDLPQYIQDEGGWMNPLIQDWYYYYADFCFYAYGDRVKLWFTMNEPQTFIIQGYQGFFQPAVPYCGDCPYTANKNVLLAHANAYHLYDQQYRQQQKGNVSIVINITDGRPVSNSSADVAAASRGMDWNSGVYLEPLLGSGNWPQQMIDIVAERSAAMGYNQSRLPRMSLAEQQHIRGTVDVLGINVYTAGLVGNNPDAPLDPTYYADEMNIGSVDPAWPASASSWLYEVPSCMTNVLNYVATYNPYIPLMVTECGWSNYPDDSLDDEGRIDYYKKYIKKALRSYQNGINLKGFTAWALMDNFEWRTGFSQRFGLHYVNFSDPNRERIPKASARWYTTVVADNGFPNTTESTTTSYTTTAGTSTTSTETSTTSTGTSTTSTETSTTSTATTPNITTSTGTTTISPFGNCTCPQQNYTGVSGLLYSPAYPQPYCDNMRCTYSITVPETQIVQLRLTGTLATADDPLKDDDLISLDFTSCTNVAALPVADSFDVVFYSDDNTLNLEFRSNTDGRVAEGFVGAWTSLPDVSNIDRNGKAALPSQTVEVEGNGINSADRSGMYHVEPSPGGSDDVKYNCSCGAQYYGGRYGLIQLPSTLSPNTHYCNNMRCSYQIEVEPGMVVQARLQGSTDDNDLIAIFDSVCRFYVHPHLSGPGFDHVFQSDTNTMGLAFQSDNNNLTDTGFTVYYEAIADAPYPPPPLPNVTLPHNCSCPRQEYNYIGPIRSPNSPFDYCGNADCEYELSTPAGTIIQLNIRGETYYDFDFVTIYGTTEGDIRLSGYFFGTYYSTTNQLRVKFTSDASAGKYGFFGFFQPCVMGLGGEGDDTICHYTDEAVEQYMIYDPQAQPL